MNRHLLPVFVCVTLFAAVTSAQVKKNTPPKPAKPATQQLQVAAPGYSFVVDIEADGSLELHVLTGYEAGLIDKGSLNKALSEYLLIQQPARGQKPVGPKVWIRPDISLDVRTVVDVIKASRVSPTAEVTVDLPDRITLHVPIDPKFERMVAPRPNPLFLVASLAEDGRLSLNNEPAGTISNASKLVKRLADVFKDREVNGVFRENSDEVEKSVFLAVPASAKFADLVKLAKALKEAGAEPLMLQVDPSGPLEAEMQ